MEEALLGQKQIRHFFKQFSEQQWNRLSKATMMLGIQSLMYENKKELFWDFSQLSLDQIEDIVVENEMKLIQRQREMRALSKDKKQSFIPMEKASGILSVKKDQPQDILQKSNTEVDKKPKKVTVVVSESQSNLDDDQSSVVPQLSNSIKKRRLSDPSPIKQVNKIQDVQQSQNKKKDIVTTDKQNQENYQVHVNRRHQQEFNKHKSSENMSQLLKADEAICKRQQKLVFGLKNSRQQPSQKEISSLRTNIHQNVPSGEQIVSKLSQTQKQEQSAPREGSRDPSYGRPSSRWRQGVSIKDNLSKLDEEFINFELQNKNKGMVYPSWWQTQDDDQFERAGSVDITNNQKEQKRRQNQEDSLDVRLRQVRDIVEQKSNFQNYNSNNLIDQRKNIKMEQGSPRNRKQDQVQKQHNKNQRINDQNESLMIDNQYPSFDKQNIAVQQSKTSLPSPNSSVHMKNIMGSSSKNVLNLLDSAYAANMNQMAANQKLSRTNESLGSFAYTKGTPKYSPVRDRNPGNQNIPMSYSGPPTQSEMNRDAKRHMSGNRNFSQTVSQEQSQRAQQNKAVLVANKLAQNQNQQYQQTFNKHRNSNQYQNMGQKTEIDNHQVYLEQQREAERNRMNVQRILQENERNEYSNQSADDDNYVNNQGYQNTNNGQPQFQNRNSNEDQGMRKFAKGGVSMTISATVTQDERSRSGSKPKYPFMDQEPFKGNGVPLRKRNDYSRQGANKQSINQKHNSTNGFYGSGSNQQALQNRKIPKEFNNIESTIKSKIDYDRRVYQERQRHREMKEFQNKNYGGDLGVTQSLNTDVNNSDGNNMQKMVNSSFFQDGEYGSQPQAQIFYKRNDKTLIYEEGVDDSYRGDNQSSYYQNYSQTKENQQQYLNAQNRGAMITSSIQKSSQLHDSASSQTYPRQNQESEHPQNIYYDDFPKAAQGGQNQNNFEVQQVMEGATLRKRTISPSTQKAIQSDQYEMKNIKNNHSYYEGGKQQYQYPQGGDTLQNQLPIELYAQQRSSFAGVEDQHNETGFTQKLLNQQRINPSISYTNLDPSNPPSSAPNARKIQELHRQGFQKEQVYESNYGKNNSIKEERSILNQVPPPSSFNRGYYDQNGEFHADNNQNQFNQKRNQTQYQNVQQSVNDRNGQINKWQQQMRNGNDNREVVEEESSYTEGGGEGGEAIQSDSENKNNTSRFAFGSGDEQNNNYSLQHQKNGYMQQQRNPNYGRFHRPQAQYQYQAENQYYPTKSGTVDVRQNNNSIVLQQYRGQNISAEQSSSFINPNISINQTGEARGAEKGQLKNQLEQMLMMKSGEFSAGRVQNGEVLLSSVGTASLGNDATNSSGLQSAPRPDASAYHQYAFVNYQPQQPISKYAQRQEINQNFTQQQSLENLRDQEIYKYENKEFQRNINDKMYYQEKQMENIALKGSIEEYRHQNYQPSHSSGYQHYQHYQKPQLQSQDNKYIQNQIRPQNKYEIPIQGSSYEANNIQQNINQNLQRNFNTSQFAQPQADHNTNYQNQSQNQFVNQDMKSISKFAQDQKLLSGPSKNNSFQHSQASASYKRASVQAGNYDHKLIQKEIPLSSKYQNTDVNKQGNNFTLQRPSVDEKNNIIRPDMQNNYYLDNSRVSNPSNRGKSRSPPKQNQVQARNPQLDHRISSGKREQKHDNNIEKQQQNNNEVNGQAAPNSNYYQTFNQNRIQKQQSQQEQLNVNMNQRQDQYENNQDQDFGQGEEEDEGEEYGNMDGGEDMEGTSQMSPDKPNDGRMTQSQIQNGDDSMAYEIGDNETKTENLRNFMEQAQPGNVLINSQGLSQQDATPNKQLESRKMTVPNAQPINYNHASKNGSQSQFDNPSNRTEDKEGGSIDEILAQQLLQQQQYNFNRNYQEQEKFLNRQQNQYAGLAAAVQQRHGAFISSGNFKEDDRKRDSSEESSPEISQTEQTSQIVTTNKKKGNEFTNDDISSSFQETPLGENTNSLSGTNTGAKMKNQHEQLGQQANKNVFQQIISDQQLQNNMQNVRKLTEKLAQMGNVSNNKNVAIYQESCDSQTNEAREGMVEITNTNSVSMSEPNNKRKQISADSDESLSPLRDSEL